jgi:hypothetical protein
MKKQDPVKIEAMFEADALRIRRDIPGITGVQIEPGLPDGHRSDAIIRFGDTAETVVVESKRHANIATAWQLIDDATRIRGARLLLIAAPRGSSHFAWLWCRSNSERTSGRFSIALALPTH